MGSEPSQAFRRLLITQIGLTLIYPLIGGRWGVTVLLGGFLMVALYGGLIVTKASPLRLWASSILGACFILSYWIGVATDIKVINAVGSAFGAVFFGFIAGVIIKHIFFFRAKVNLDLIYGSISVYLLIGSAFTELYVALALFNPNAFTGFDTTADLDTVVRALSYYSFVTLSTLGYGDITPTASYTRVLAYSQAVIGQLYLTILVARLVGTYIAQERHE